MNFMKSHCCYDAIPTSSKLVVFDTTLEVLCVIIHTSSKMVMFDTTLKGRAGREMRVHRRHDVRNKLCQAL
ncbi:unnamed protein product [Boreogadus saida]